MVCFAGMLSLFSAVAMHAVRVYHQFELASGLLQCINQLEAVLEMHVVVTCSMGELQAYGIR